MNNIHNLLVVGSHGTVGIELMERLENLQFFLPNLRFDTVSGYDDSLFKAKVVDADLLVLCLPSDIAIQKASEAILLGQPTLRIIDTSTAFKLEPDWVYGLPELPGQSDKIRAATFVANPGCFATGVILMAEPLRRLGFMDTYQTFVGTAGYSAGGRKMIESPPVSTTLCALQGNHKHLPEIRQFANVEPSLILSVGPFYRGMSIQTLVLEGREEVLSAWREAYKDSRYIKVMEDTPDKMEVGYEMDDLELRAYEHEDGQTLCVATYDNLGKGAAGSVIQNLKLMLGL